MNLAERLLNQPDLIEGVHYVIENDRIYPIVRGGATGGDDGDDGDDNDDSQDDDDGADDGDDDDGDGEGDDEDDEDEQKFSQKDVNRIMAKEKKDGRRAGRKAILAELGFESVEEAKKKIAAASKAKPKGKPADDDDTDDDQSPEPEVDRTLSRLEARAERLLIRAGAPDDDRTLKGLIVMLDLDSSMDEEDVTSAVEDLKDERSALFDTTDKKAPKSKPRPSDPGSGRRKAKVKSVDKASSLMERRHGKPAGASGK